MPENDEIVSPATRLLNWYDRHRRALPWRALPGEDADPYRVWLSEIMLQQTTVATVKEYFQRFTARWPDVGALAAAERDDVLKEWAGLGYYARARNLHACARIVAERHGGRFPDTEAALRELPGVGLYTAAAIASIAFGRRAVVVDGNVERVVARWRAIEDPLPGARKRLYGEAAFLTPDARPGDYAQAMMDLGATVCTPRKPACGLCPLMADCAGRLAGIAGTLPRKIRKPPKPTRFGVAFVVVREDGAVLLDRRPDSGLLGGMMEPPNSDWTEDQPERPQAAAPLRNADWREAGEARHTFTHFHLRLKVLRADAAMNAQPSRGRWTPKAMVEGEALPTAMRKALKLGLSA